MVVVVWDFPIVIPLQVIQLYSALPWIVAICMEYLYNVKRLMWWWCCGCLVWCNGNFPIVIPIQDR